MSMHFAWICFEDVEDAFIGQAHAGIRDMFPQSLEVKGASWYLAKTLSANDDHCLLNAMSLRHSSSFLLLKTSMSLSHTAVRSRLASLGTPGLGSGFDSADRGRDSEAAAESKEQWY